MDEQDRGGELNRDELILAHLWVVRAIAANLKQSLLYSADWDELVSVGNLALVKCAGRYQARNHCQFKTYAYKFIRGDMIRSFTRIDGHHHSALIDFTPLVDYPVAATQQVEVEHQQHATILNSLLTALRPRQREVIDAYLAGNSLVELARSKGVARDRLMKWQRTGIKQLLTAGAPYRAC